MVCARVSPIYLITWERKGWRGFTYVLIIVPVSKVLSRFFPSFLLIKGISGS